MKEHRIKTAPSKAVSAEPAGGTGLLDKRPGLRPLEPALVEVKPLALTWAQRWVNFWFTPAAPVGLHILRVLSGLLFLGWLLAFAGHVDDLFGLHGWFDVQAYREAGRLSPAPFGWSILYVFGYDSATLHTVYWLSVVVLGAFTLGLFPRLTSVLTWVIVVSFVANPAISYDADYLLVVLAFYLMVGYLLYGLWHQPRSPLELVLGPWDACVLSPWLFRSRNLAGVGAERRSYAANLVLRLFQVHFAVIVVTAGLHKLQFGEWWAGVALWFPLHPPYQTTYQDIRGSLFWNNAYLFFFSLVHYAVLAWQLGFPLFAWRGRGWRIVLVCGGLLGWIGSVWVLRLPLFGPIFLLGCLSYLTPTEWHWAGNRFSQLFHRFLRASKSAEHLVGTPTKVKA